MRFGIVWFFSLLLLLPPLVASKQYSPLLGPGRGDIVDYQAALGRNRGIVVGRQGGNLHIAPLTSDSPHPSSGQGVIAHSDRIVETHPRNVVVTGYRDPATASRIANEHLHNTPDILEGGGSLHRRSTGIRRRR